MISERRERGFPIRHWILSHIEILLVGLISFVLLVLGSANPEPSNNFSFLADAFIHGRIWVNADGSFVNNDTVVSNGFHYIIEGPFPALLTIPSLLVWGLDPRGEVVTSNVVGAIGVMGVWRLCEILGLGRAKRLWMCVFAFAGSDYWWAASRGSVWFMSPIVSFVLTIFGYIECVTKRRWWVLSLIFVATIFTRITLFPAVIMYLVYTRERKRFVLGVLAGLGVMVVYNEARWGTLNDVGYILYYTVNDKPSVKDGLFNISYLPYNLYTYILMTPQYLDRFPWLKMPLEGTSLTFTSPALVMALYKKQWMLVLAFLIAIPSLVYYVNGWAQVGCRHALDFIPFCLIPMIYAMRDCERWWFRPLIVVSAVMGMFALYSWNTR